MDNTAAHDVRRHWPKRGQKYILHNYEFLYNLEQMRWAGHVEKRLDARGANRYRHRHGYYFLGSVRNDGLNKDRHDRKNNDPKEQHLFG